MGCIQMGYVQVQWSVSCSDSWCLKLVREMWVSSFRDFCNSFQSRAAENWKERRPKEELALGVTSEINLSPYTAWRCVGSLLCWKQTIVLLSANQIGWRIAAECCGSHCWLSLPWIRNKSLTVSPAMHPHIITPPPCFTVGTTHARSSVHLLCVSQRHSGWN